MRTLYAWANERPEFEEAVEAAWHVLHAYWIRLLRENITNPALRQSAILSILAKRFPSTWGQEPRNTLEHFTKRNEPRPSIEGGSDGCPSCAKAESMSLEEIQAEIAKLEARRMHDQ